MKDMHGIIFAYAANSRLRELTEKRTVASIPFGGRYRIIDFTISNMVNSGVTDIGVILGDSYQSLLDHIGSGKDWDLSRKRGGLKLLPPFGYAENRFLSGYKGKMDALGGVLSYIQRIRQKYVVLSDSELVSTIDLDPVMETHFRTGADITAVCTYKPVGNPESSTYFTFGRRGFVADVASGLLKPQGCESLGVYVLETELLTKLINHCTSHSLSDFERDVLQKMLGTLNIAGHVVENYAAKIQSTASYFKHSMELLHRDIRGELFQRRRPVMTKVRDEASTYYAPGAVMRNCLVADGCFIEGEVENCVLFRGVKIEKGAKVQNCILMQDTLVRSGALLTYTISDKDVIINQSRMLMGHVTYPLAVSKGAVV